MILERLKDYKAEDNIRLWRYSESDVNITLSMDTKWNVHWQYLLAIVIWKSLPYIHHKLHFLENQCSCNPCTLRVTNALHLNHRGQTGILSLTVREISAVNICHVCSGHLRATVIVTSALLMVSNKTCLYESCNPSLTESHTQVLIILEWGSAR